MCFFNSLSATPKNTAVRCWGPDWSKRTSPRDPCRQSSQSRQWAPGFMGWGVRDLSEIEVLQKIWGSQWKLRGSGKKWFLKKSPRPLCCIVGSCWIIVQHSENQTTRLRSPSILIQTKFNAQQQRVTHQQASWEESQIVVMIIAVQSVCIYI